jgi:hypothetical protein
MRGYLVQRDGGTAKQTALGSVSFRTLVIQHLEEKLESEVTALLGRRRYQRRQPQHRRWVQARCGKCGAHDARRFRRNGHYRRYLNTAWGRLRVRMPQLECLCGGKVHVPFRSVRPWQRVWGDLERQVRERAGRGESLRSIKEQVDQRVGGSVGLRTLNERVHAVAQLVPQGQQA